MIEVRIQEEVLDFLRTLPPKPKQALRKALRELAEEQGDILPLTDELDGFHRLRVGSYRVIFCYETVDDRRRIACIYAAQRKWVYDIFRSQLSD